VVAQAFRLERRENRLGERLRFHVRVREGRRDRAVQVYEKVRDWWGRWWQVLAIAVTPSERDREYIELPPRWQLLYFGVRPVRVLQSWWSARREGEQFQSEATAFRERCTMRGQRPEV
jgi:hypothetical protein